MMALANDAERGAGPLVVIHAYRHRADIVRAFASLPDEAFGFFVGVMLNMSFEAGGFQSDSRAAIEALGKLVRAFYDLNSEKPQSHKKK